MYYEVQIEFLLTTDDSEKVKKVKESWLVDALSVTEAEARAVAEIGTPQSDFEVRAVKPSKIQGVLDRVDLADKDI